MKDINPFFEVSRSDGSIGETYTIDEKVVESDDSAEIFVGYGQELLSDKKPSKSSVTQSNELVSASYHLSVDAKRLLLIAISKIDPTKPINLSIDHDGKKYIRADPIRINVTDWKKYYAGSEARIYSQMKKASDDLWNSSAIIMKNDVSQQECRWIQERKYHDGTGTVEVIFTSRVLTHMSMLYETFTSYKLINIGDLKSFHSIRLYELLSQFRATGWRKMLIPDFKLSMGLEKNSYTEMFDLRRRVIDKSIKDINQKTDMLVKYSLEKKGRKIVAVTFYIADNPQQKLDL